MQTDGQAAQRTPSIGLGLNRRSWCQQFDAGLGPAVALFQLLADETWQRVHDAGYYGITQGEETITDHLLLEILRAHLPEVRSIKKATRQEESRWGIDWEWHIGNDDLGYVRYAVQAKKLDHERYSHLAHCGENNKLQIDLLEDYANITSAVPLYCLYNHTGEDTQSAWHCVLGHDQTQLGCTVVPLDQVRLAIQTRGRRNFSFLHSCTDSLPWRCLVRCRAIQKWLRDGRPEEHKPFAWLRRDAWSADLPEHIQVQLRDPYAVVSGRFAGKAGDLPEPRRILIVTVPTIV
jgi:hypothetical protein